MKVSFASLFPRCSTAKLLPEWFEGLFLRMDSAKDDTKDLTKNVNKEVDGFAMRPLDPCLMKFVENNTFLDHLLKLLVFVSSVL